MTKAFWLFATNAGDGTAENPSRPALPAVGGKWTSPGDVIKLTGPVAAPHRHLLVGGLALQDDNLDGEVGEGHVHYVLRNGESWWQTTVDAVPHTHVLNIGANNTMIPDYFLLFWVGTNADALTIAGDPNCFPVVEAEIVDGFIGDLVAGWATQDTAWWHAKVLNMLGMQLPVEITNGERLMKLFLGALLSRNAQEEKAYRYTRV